MYIHAAGRSQELKCQCCNAEIDLYKLWSVHQQCQTTQATTQLQWSQIASIVLGQPAYFQDAARDMHALYMQKLHHFDNFLYLHQHLTGSNGYLATAAAPAPAPAPDVPAGPLAAPGTAGQADLFESILRHGQKPYTSHQLGDLVHLQAAEQQLLSAPVTRGQKRARSMSPDLSAQARSFGPSAFIPSPVGKASTFSMHLPHGQGQPQPHLEQKPHLMQPTHAPGLYSSHLQGLYTSQPALSLPCQPLYPVASQLQQPYQHPHPHLEQFQQQHQQQHHHQQEHQPLVNATAGGATNGDVQPALTTYGGLPGHIEGMTPEQLLAAAKQAAEASGYCSPQDLGNHGTSVQARLLKPPLQQPHAAWAGTMRMHGRMCMAGCAWQDVHAT